MTGCPTIFLSFLYHQHNLSIKDRRPGVTVESSIHKNTSKLWKDIKDQINYSSFAATNKETSTFTLHQPLEHTYILCTLSMRKRGEKEK